MSLTTDFWTIVPAGNGVLYSGTIPSPVWTAIPNYLNQSAVLNVNITTSFVTPTAGTTLTLVGSLPTGWTFVDPTLSYDGSGVGGPSTISFTATNAGLSTPGPSFSIQGVGTPSSDTVAPTVPIGLYATGVSASSVTLNGLTPSDPNQAGHTWSGLQQINITRTPPGSVIGHTTVGPGNQPIFALQDIGAQTSVFSQSGADILLTTAAVDTPYPTNSALGFACQQLTGTSWVITCKVSAFSPANAFDNVRLEARASLNTNAAYVAMLCQSFSGTQGFKSEYRAADGGNATTLQTQANSTAPCWLSLTRNADIYVFAYSLDGNVFTTLGNITQSMGSTLYVGVGLNTSDGVSIGPITIQQVSVQTLANWSYVDSTVSGSTAYAYTATAQDSVPNVSAASTSVSVTTTGAGAIKWNPGPYLASDHFAVTAQSQVQDILDALKALYTSSGSLYWKGVRIMMSPGGIETSQGVYDWTAIDAVLSWMNSNLPVGSRQLSILLLLGSFGQSLGATSNHQVVPTYIQTNPGTYGAGPFASGNSGVWGYRDASNNSSGTYTFNLCNANVVSRINALIAAMGARYDTNPQFESLTHVETTGYFLVGGLYGGPPGWSINNCIAALQSICNASVAAFPHTSVALQNAFDNNATTAQNMEIWQMANRIAVGAPDTVGQTAFTSYNFASPSSQLPWGLKAYMGIQATGSTAAVTDQRTKVACQLDVQAFNMAGNYWSNIGAPNGFLPSDILTAINTTYKSSHSFISYMTGPEGVLPYGGQTVANSCPWASFTPLGGYPGVGATFNVSNVFSNIGYPPNFP